MKMKKMVAMALSAAMCVGMAATPVMADGHSLTVSGIGGSLNWLPVYIAEQEGWFEEENLEIEEVLFTNGPVQMESLSSDGWDLGCTGVGGVIAGALGYDAKILGASNTDDGTQYVFARSDSDILKAGQGNNTINDEIYGDAETWKGKKILCNTGSVTQYVLIKMLEGFGLTQNDVEFIAMDPATAYSAFLAGEGDACVLTGSGGTFKMLDNTEDYTAVASGPLVDSGLMCNFVANKNSYEDEETYEASAIYIVGAQEPGYARGMGLKTRASFEEALEDAKKKFVGENPNILALPMTFKKAAVHLCMKNPEDDCMDAYGHCHPCMG
nr:ABC transporter substrate-binding protein [uncultured Blautia sp.]